MATAIKDGVVFQENEQLLALSLLTMESATQKNIPFLTPEDFYPREKIREDEKVFQEIIVNWMKKSDEVFTDIVDYPTSFSGNGFWWLAKLENLHYVHKLSLEISNKFNAIEFDIPEDLIVPIKSHVNFNKLTLLFTSTGLECLTSCLIKALPEITISNTRHVAINLNHKKINEPIVNLIFRMPEIIFRRTKDQLFRLMKFNLKKEKLYWVVQGGYEAKELKDFFSQYEFKEVTLKMLQVINDSRDTLISIEEEKIFSMVSIFDQTVFGKLSPIVTEVIKDYITNVIQHLPNAKKIIKQMLETENPNGLIYSLGSANILEQLIAFEANRKKIKVYYFKHGGIENTFLNKSVIDNYFEYSPVILRTQFLHSKIELDNLPLNVAKPVIINPLNNFQITSLKTKKKQKILYSVGPPSHWSYKDFYKIILDSERYLFINDLLKLSDKLDLNVDVKVHPAEWKRVYDFFKLKPTKNFKLLVGGSIERITSNYAIVVLDIISSRVLSNLMYTDMPIIIFKPKGVELNTKYEELLRQRVHLVSNSDELEEILNKFKMGDISYQYDNFNKNIFENKSDEKKEKVFLKYF